MSRSGFALMALLLALPLGAAAGVPVEDLLIDRPAADFEAHDLGGETVKLSDFRGKVVVLNFWGIWCPPCRMEIPELREMHRALRAQGLEVLAVNTGDDRNDVPRFVEKEKIDYRVVFDDGATDQYGIVAFPSNFVLDRRGRIRYASEGFHPGAMESIRAVVEHLLRAPEGTGAGD